MNQEVYIKGFEEELEKIGKKLTTPQTYAFMAGLGGIGGGLMTPRELISPKKLLELATTSKYEKFRRISSFGKTMTPAVKLPYFRKLFGEAVRMRRTFPKRLQRNILIGAALMSGFTGIAHLGKTIEKKIKERRK